MRPVFARRTGRYVPDDVATYVNGKATGRRGRFDTVLTPAIH